MKNTKDTKKVTITVDLDALRVSLMKIGKENGGLESSGGTTVSDLDQAWDGMSSMMPEELRDLMGGVISVMHEVEDETGTSDDEDDDFEDDE